VSYSPSPRFKEQTGSSRPPLERRGGFGHAGNRTIVPVSYLFTGIGVASILGSVPALIAIRLYSRRLTEDETRR